MRLSSRTRAFLITIAVAGLLLLAGCIPEANRERGGDPGGDIGNWSDDVNMHGEDPAYERIYYETPLMGKGIERSIGAE